MEIRQLRTFLAVAEMLSFNRAATRLHYAQSSVSAQVQGLEEELNVQLFDRTGRSILLTEAGEQLRLYARKMVDLAVETEQSFKSRTDLTGTLTIRIPESFGIWRLPDILDSFRDPHPQVHFHFRTCALEGLEKDLLSGVTDLAFLLDEGIGSADLVVEMLETVPLVAVARPGGPLHSASPVSTAHMAQVPWFYSRLDCSYRRLVEMSVRHSGAELPQVIELNSLAAVKACVEKGLGWTVVPLATVRGELARNELAVVTWPEGPGEVALLMIRHRRRWVSPLLDKFMGVVRACCTLRPTAGE